MVATSSFPESSHRWICLRSVASRLAASDCVMSSAAWVIADTVGLTTVWATPTLWARRRKDAGRVAHVEPAEDAAQ